MEMTMEERVAPSSAQLAFLCSRPSPPPSPSSCCGTRPDTKPTATVTRTLARKRSKNLREEEELATLEEIVEPAAKRLKSQETIKKTKNIARTERRCTSCSRIFSYDAPEGWKQTPTFLFCSDCYSEYLGKARKEDTYDCFYDYDDDSDDENED